MSARVTDRGYAILAGAAKVERALCTLQQHDGPAPDTLKGIYQVGGYMVAGDTEAARLSAIWGDWEGVEAELALGVCGLLDSGCADAVQAIGGHLQAWADNWCEVTGYEGELQ